MKRTSFLLAAALTALTALPAFAQGSRADGEVMKIDRAGARITLKHQGIKNLDMPPMTMAFHLRDARLLEHVNVGDKVQFSATKLDGSYTVTALSKAP